MDPKAYWVGSNYFKGIGAFRTRVILDHFGDLETAWHAPIDGFAEIGIPPKTPENIQQTRNQLNLEKICANLATKGIELISWENEIYPRRLKEVDQLPPVMFVRGEIKVEDDWAVAIVGTRRMTVYRRQVTEDPAIFLATNGVTVVSGLDQGADFTAHSFALKNCEHTVAVLGCGVDQIYPPEKRKLNEEICP
jgi:DNA processing protein